MKKFITVITGITAVSCFIFAIIESVWEPVKTHADETEAAVIAETEAIQEKEKWDAQFVPPVPADNAVSGSPNNDGIALDEIIEADKITIEGLALNQQAVFSINSIRIDVEKKVWLDLDEEAKDEISGLSGNITVKRRQHGYYVTLYPDRDGEYYKYKISDFDFTTINGYVRVKSFLLGNYSDLENYAKANMVE